MQALYTDFSAGEISKKFSGRIDLGVYKKGCETLKNFQSLPQGGFQRRPGTKYIADLPSKVRLIGFTVDATHSFLVEFSNLQMRIWQNDTLIEFSEGVTVTDSPYSESELNEIHHVQSYDRIFFTHKNHSIRQLIYSTDVFTWGELSISGRSGQTLPFQSIGEYPRTCAIASGRLWLASSINKPSTIWGSRPFEYGDFTDKDIIEITTINYTDPAGWADPAIPEYETSTSYEDSITYSHAIEITIGSDKNEQIRWISGQQDIVVGTMTGEYVIPGTITALQQAAYLRSRYGSAGIQGKVVDSATLFVQSDKKKIREYYALEGAYQSPDLTFFSDHILQNQVIDFDYQRTPDPKVFCTLSTGDLKVLTYTRMYNVASWSQWDLGGPVEQVCVLDEATSETVYLVVIRDGARKLEKLYEPYEDTYHLDCALDVVAGADGVISYPFESDNWVVMNSDGDLVTELEAETSYTIGMLFISYTKLMRFPAKASLKRSTMMFFRVVGSYQFTCGYNGRLESIGTPDAGYPFTGDVKAQLSGEYNADLQYEVKIDTHRPLMITAVMPDVEVI